MAEIEQKLVRLSFATKRHVSDEQGRVHLTCCARIGDQGIVAPLVEVHPDGLDAQPDLEEDPEETA